jgi:septal ring factor EnvC (AmiA/AmiB activator)
MKTIDKMESLEFQVETLTNKLLTAKEEIKRLLTRELRRNEKWANAILKRNQMKKSMNGQIQALEKQVEHLRAQCESGSRP